MVSDARVSMAILRSLIRDAAPADGTRIHGIEVPVDAEPRHLGSDRMTVVDREAQMGEVVELRDVLDPCGVRDCGGERDVQLHQEVWAHRNIERLGQMGNLEPRRNSADSRAIHLYDAARIALE